MKALRFHELGGPEVLAIDEVPRPAIQPDEVLIRNEAMALNFSDLLYLRDQYRVKARLPATLGMEGAGVVVEVGPEVTEVRPGDRVAYIGMGAFAEFKRLRASQVIALPDSMSFAEGAAFPIAALTAWHVLHTSGRVRAGDEVVVHSAAGGVGLAAVQIARAAGARVIGVVSTEEKAKVAREAGADVVLTYEGSLNSAIRGATGGRGADIILDAVGLPTFEEGLKALAPFGRMVLFGRAGGAPPPLDPLRLLARSQTVTSLALPMTYAYRELHDAAVRETMALVATGALRIPIGGTFPLAEAREALTLLSQRRTIGKLLLVP